MAPETKKKMALREVRARPSRRADVDAGGRAGWWLRVGDDEERAEIAPLTEDGRRGSSCRLEEA